MNPNLLFFFTKKYHSTFCKGAIHCSPVPRSNTLLVRTHQIQPIINIYIIGGLEADTKWDCRTCLARPNSKLCSAQQKTEASVKCVTFSPVPRSNTLLVRTHQIQPIINIYIIGGLEADTKWDCRTCLARPNSKVCSAQQKTEASVKCVTFSPVPRSNTLLVRTHQIQPIINIYIIGGLEADTKWDCRTCLARPNSKVCSAQQKTEASVKCVTFSQSLP